MALKFKLYNIPISIHLNFMIVVVLLSLERLRVPAFFLSWVVVVTVSIILHELGHALAAKYFGQSPRIELRGIAGLTYTIRNESKVLQNFIISISGPLLGIIIGLTGLFLKRYLPADHQVLQVILSDIIGINLYWSLANLLPILPLDGGNISQIFLTRLFQFRGKLVAYLLSILVIFPLGIYFLLKGSIFLALLAAYLGIYNIRGFLFFVKRGADARYSRDIAIAYNLLQQNRQAEAIALGVALLDRVTNPQVRKDLYRLLGRAYYHKQDYSQAQEIMNKVEGKSPEDERLAGFICYNLGQFEQAQAHFQKVIHSTNVDSITRPYFLSLLKTENFARAYDLATGFFQQKIDTDLLVLLAAELHREKQFDRSLRLSTIVYERSKSPAAAYRAACVLARSGDTTRALMWLEKALDAGFNDAAALREDPDLRDLQSLPGFQALLARLS